MKQLPNQGLQVYMQAVMQELKRLQVGIENISEEGQHFIRENYLNQVSPIVTAGQLADLAIQGSFYADPPSINGAASMYYSRTVR